MVTTHREGDRYLVKVGEMVIVLKPFLRHRAGGDNGRIGKLHELALSHTAQGIYTYRRGFVALSNEYLREAASAMNRIARRDVDILTQKDRHLAINARTRLERMATEVVAREFMKVLRG